MTLNKNTEICIGIIALVLLGYAIWSGGAQGGISKNVETLRSVRNLPIEKEEVIYFPGADGYFVRPADGNIYPGVVMIHENRGLRPEIRLMAEELAKEGYMVLAVDLLGAVVETQEEARALTAEFNQLRGIENMRMAVEFLKKQGADKIASLGWCFGGAQSLELALSGEELDATIIYYGRLPADMSVLTPVKWPVLGIFGAEDQVISVENVNTFEKALNDSGIYNEIYIYPGVGHAFANPSGNNYAPEETEDAWGKTLKFL